MKRAISLILFISLTASAIAQTYQVIYTPPIQMISFKSVGYNFDSKKLLFFQPQGISGAPCLLDSQEAHTYKIHNRAHNIYKPYNGLLNRIKCEDHFHETCWGDPVDIYCLSPNDSNFVIAYQKIQGYQNGTGNCVSPMHETYISYNGGQSRSSIFSSVPVWGIDIDPVNDNIVYIGANTYIYKSINRGANFTITAGIPTLNGMVKIHRNNPSIIFAKGSTAMHRSTNAGASFTQLPVPPFTDIAFDGMNVYGTAVSGVYKSTNWGADWVQISSIQSVNIIEINPDNPAILYIGTANGLYRSLNGGMTFNYSNINYPGLVEPNNIIGISKSTATGDSLYVCTKSRVFKVWDLLTGTNEITATVPERFSLYQNFPNPFNPSTTISFDLAKNSFVKMNIYDASGKLVKEFINGNLNRGNYTYNWNGTGMSSGVYYYRLEATAESGEKFVQAKKMLLVK